MSLDTTLMILGELSATIALIVGLWMGLRKKYPTHKSPDFLIDGDLIIDTKDPHKDVLRFELYYDPEILLDEGYGKEFVHFRIVRNDKKEI